MMSRSLLPPTLAGLAALALGAAPAAAADAVARLHDPEGRNVGQVALTETPHGVLLHLHLRDMPAGAHAFHVHAVGRCIPPFTSAGGHFNPTDTDHGLMDDDGMHVGDMPNLHVPAGGTLQQEVLNPALALDDALFDDDGAAIVIHAGPDDYATDPAGAAGPRIACGAITR